MAHAAYSLKGSNTNLLKIEGGNALEDAVCAVRPSTPHFKRGNRAQGYIHAQQEGEGGCHKG